MSYINITKLDPDLNLWDKGLDFYKDELSVLEKRLLEVADKNNSQDALQGLEHFQNQFMIQRKNIQDIKHDVRKYKADISADIQHHAGRVNEDLVEDGRSVRNKYENFEKIMNGLRHEFNTYLGKWM